MKPTITKLHFTIAQRYFKPSCMQTKSSPVSCPSVLYPSSYLHSAFREASFRLCTSTGNCSEHRHTAIMLIPGTIRLAHMLTTCHEEFITTLLGRGNTRSKVPRLELIQLPPNSAFDKAARESALDPSMRWNGPTRYSLPSTRQQCTKQVI